MLHVDSRGLRTLIAIVASLAMVALLAANTALGALVTGSLPTAGFVHTSVADNTVDMTGTGIHLKTKAPVNVKTTYSRVTPSANFVGGWHHHNGPVIVTVTVGTLTFYDEECGTWDVSAGHTYIESTGEVLNAKVLPAKNTTSGIAEWFTTRLYPLGASDPTPEDAAPCTP